MFLKFVENETSFVRDEQAATAVEYAIMIVLIAAVVIVGVGLLGGATEQSFDKFVTTYDSVRQ